MPFRSFVSAAAQLQQTTPVNRIGRIGHISPNLIRVTGLSDVAQIGDLVLLAKGPGALVGEVVQIARRTIVVLPEKGTEALRLSDPVRLKSAPGVAPCAAWMGRVVDPFGQPLDGRALPRGDSYYPIHRAPPPAAKRRSLGPRLSTGLHALNTFLPLARGQRIGLFAGSGVGKSNLLGHLAARLEADVVVLALIGERGRELGHILREVLSEDALRRTVIVAATSDQSPLMRRRTALSAMAVAEYFRDNGQSVLYLADSITRLAEAHREIAVSAGEAPVLRGFPPSTTPMITSLCERAGPGLEGQGDITGVFSVLVAGSDMEEPVADILRGVLDGHIVLDRAIAERGRYPAIDLVRSVSRSLPNAATEEENRIIFRARGLLAKHDQSAVMIRAGLHSPGADEELDTALKCWDELDAFLGNSQAGSIGASFDQLRLILRRAGASI